jgi:xanthine dehydrogenase accessory factor
MKNFYLQILKNPQNIHDLVLATVIGTKGSTPQIEGSSALFSTSGLICGTIGGGVVEGKVQEIAKKSAVSKKSGSYFFQLDNSAPDGEDALCGGNITILLDSDLSKHIAVFEEIKHSFGSGTPGVLITAVTGIEEKTVINRYWMTDSINPSLPRDLMVLIGQEIADLFLSLRQDDFRKIEITLPGEENYSAVFLEPVIPPFRLIIAGAGHIGKALSKIGQMLDFEVTVIDDRPEFANADNLQSADHIITGDIGKAIGRLEKRDDTYIVIVTRGHKDDANALRACITSEAAYIGMIGSRNKVALMHNDFVANSWATEEQWSRIFAPVGLDIKSKTVEEIAISIAAQLVQVKNLKK